MNSAPRQMGISRTTVTEIYERARTKVADCLVNGKPLKITGGNYRLCDGTARQCCGRTCTKQIPETAGRRKDDGTMKIAVTYDNGMVFQHFGHTEQFKVYTVEDNQITDTEIVSSGGNGHGGPGRAFIGTADRCADLRRYRRRRAERSGLLRHPSLRRRIR